MKTVVYHSADYDGILCRETAKHFLKDDPNVQYIGWNFGDEPIPLPINGEFIIMDLPLDKPFGLTFRDGWAMKGTEQFQPLDRIDWDKFTWIDHHKTAIDTHPANIPGYRIEGVAACRLAWQWFSEQRIAEKTGEAMRLPEKEYFIDRSVSEPAVIRLAGEYDIWDKRDPDAETLQYGLRAFNPIESTWEMLLRDGVDAFMVLGRILEIGKPIEKYAKQENESLALHKTFILEWEGLKFLALNSAKFNSLVFAAKDVPETGHDALIGFFFTGKYWAISMYHAKHRKELNLSDIAKKYGGGGHPGACGFTCRNLPFAL